MQSALRVDFCTLSCCMLHHQLLFDLCMISPLPGWHLGPLLRPLEALFFDRFWHHFGPCYTLSYCMLRHLLLFVLCMFYPLPGWYLGPLFRPLEALFFTLLGVILVPESTPSYAVCIAR